VPDQRSAGDIPADFVASQSLVLGPLTALSSSGRLLAAGSLDRLTPEQQVVRQRVLDATPEVHRALNEIMEFRRLLHERDSTAVEPWPKMAEGSEVPETRSFAARIRRDQAWCSRL
jgi:hypothetical protein